MMEQLQKEGWNINENLTAELFADGVLPKSSSEILKTILDEDLRDFGQPSIINLHRKEENVFDGPCVLQLLRYRNVSVPRIKEEMNQADPASSIIRLFFTDGHTSISAILLESIPGINADTPPGTKILINGRISVEGGIFLILTKKDVKILGGRVPDLIEKWNVEKNSVRADGFKAKSAAGKGTGAPKWISFGKRGAQKNAQLEKGFKANNVMPKNVKEGEESDEFAKNREQMLKDLEEGEAGKKTFAKPNLVPPPPKEKTEPVPREPKEPKPRKEFKRRGRKNSEDGPDIDVGEYANHKPSGGVTLFDFIGGETSAVGKMTEQMERVERVHVREEPPKSTGRGGGSHRGGRGGGADRNAGRGRGAPAGTNRRADGERVSERGFNQEPRKSKPVNNFFNTKNTPDANQGGARNRPKNETRQNAPPQRTSQDARHSDGIQQPQSSNRHFQNRPHAGPMNHQNNREQQPRNQNNNRQQYPPPAGYQHSQRDRPPRDNQAPQRSSGGNFNPNQHFQGPQWRVGSQCLASWTDGAIYPATVVDIQPNRMCTVRYNEYGNVHTLPIDFLIIPS